MNHKLAGRCPICGKIAAHYAAKYHTKTFYFCSERCVRVFDNNLLLHATRYGREAQPLFKSRRLCLADVCSPEKMQLIKAQLQNMIGLISIASEHNCLIISYDLLQVTQARIESALKEIDVTLSNSWQKRVCRHWTHRMEKTELANFAAY